MVCHRDGGAARIPRPRCAPEPDGVQPAQPRDARAPPRFLAARCWGPIPVPRQGRAGVPRRSLHASASHRMDAAKCGAHKTSPKQFAAIGLSLLAAFLYFRVYALTWLTVEAYYASEWAYFGASACLTLLNWYWFARRRAHRAG